MDKQKVKKLLTLKESIRLDLESHLDPYFEKKKLDLSNCTDQIELSKIKKRVEDEIRGIDKRIFDEVGYIFFLNQYFLKLDEINRKVEENTDKDG